VVLDGALGDEELSGDLSVCGSIAARRATCSSCGVSWSSVSPVRLRARPPELVEQFSLYACQQSERDLNALAVAALLILMGSVAWRRANPTITTLVACLALIAFVVASGYNGDGSLEAAAIALNFYILGQRSRPAPRPSRSPTRRDRTSC
jgi:hypothetical protein